MATLAPSRETTTEELEQEEEEEEEKKQEEEEEEEEEKEAKKKEEEGKEEGEGCDGVPYDRGWAWVVAFGTFIIYTLYAGYVKCYSLFYVELLHRFGANATETAVFFSIRLAMFGIGSLVIMNVVVGHLGERRTVLIGGVLMSLSGILPSLASDMTTIIWLQGVCLGLGQSMIISPGEVLLGKYFRKKRALVFALANCGGSVGGIVMPLLVTLFLQTYALSGALLLTGALCLHVLPAALLYRPLSYFTETTSQQTPSRRSRDKFTQADKSPESTQALMTNDFQTNNQKSEVVLTSGSVSSSFPDLLSTKTASATKERHSSLSELSEQQTIDIEYAVVVSNPQGTTAKSPSDVIWNSASSLHRSERSCEHREERISLAEKTTESVCPPERQRSISCPKLTRFTLDFSLFRSPLFRLLLCYFVLFNMVNVMVSYLPALASENDVTDAQNGVLLSIIGGLDLVCRIACAVIANSGLLRVPTLVIISYVTLGVASQFVRFLTSFQHFVALSVLLGLLGAVGNTMFPVLVIEFVGIDNMAKALGFVLLVLAVSASACFPLLGYIRDVTGSYVAVYHVIGVGAILAAGFLCCEKWVRRLEKRGDPPDV